MAGYSQAAMVSAYRSVAVHGVAAEADPHRLISILFDGALERLSLAKSCIEVGKKVDKTQALHRVVQILNELRASLDHSVGGELSNNLERLYDYMVRRTLHANLHSDAQAIDEVGRLLSQIRNAWDAIPVDQRARQAG